MVALRRTDDGGRTMGGTRHWRGAAEYMLWTERSKKDEWREETGKMFWRARHPDESRRGGEKEGTKIISDGKHRIIKIGA